MTGGLRGAAAGAALLALAACGDGQPTLSTDTRARLVAAAMRAQSAEAPPIPPQGGDTAVAAGRAAILREGRTEANLVALGRLQLRAGDGETAVGTFAEAAALNPRSAAALGGLGVAYDMAGDAEAAGRAHRAALALSPGDWAIRSNLAYSLVTGGAAREAVVLLAEAETRPGVPAHARHNLALALAAEGQPDRAARVLRADMGPVEARAIVEEMTAFARTTPSRSGVPSSTMLAPAVPRDDVAVPRAAVRSPAGAVPLAGPGTPPGDGQPGVGAPTGTPPGPPNDPRPVTVASSSGPEGPDADPPVLVRAVPTGPIERQPDLRASASVAEAFAAPSPFGSAEPRPSRAGRNASYSGALVASLDPLRPTVGLDGPMLREASTGLPDALPTAGMSAETAGRIAEAQAALRVGDLNAAEAILRAVRALDPDPVRIGLLEARIARAVGDNARARRALEAAARVRERQLGRSD